jgi:L-fucose mutarotase
VDANYPATRGRRLIHLPGIDMPRTLQAVLSAFPIDTFILEPCAVMQLVGEPDAPVVAEINAALANHGAKPAVSLERHAFYAAAETAYAIVQTGERRFYGNFLLTKGVVPPEEHA